MDGTRLKKDRTTDEVTHGPWDLFAVNHPDRFSGGARNPDPATCEVAKRDDRIEGPVIIAAVLVRLRKDVAENPDRGECKVGKFLPNIPAREH